jgi:hypothetical protein
MADLITLSADGRLVADDENTGERLLAASGRYQLVPSGPDWMVLVRSPAQGGTITPPRVALAGDMSCTSLTELVEFLHQGRRTGVLRVVMPGGDRAIVLKDGMIRGATSDDPSDSLGEVCLRLGLVQRAALDAVLKQSPPPARVGRLLVEAGALQSHDLFKAVQQQVTEIFHAMLLGREGTFVLTDEAVEGTGGVQLNTQGLLMDSVRRIDEMAQFRLKLPSNKLYISRRKPPGPALEPEERQVYDLCSGDRTLLDLAREMRISEFETTRHVYHLIQGGYVASATTPQMAPGESRKNDPAEVAKVFNRIFKEILAEVAKHEVATEFIAAANGALQSEAATRSPFLHGISFSRDATLDPTRLLSNVKAGQGPDDPARMLFQALSEVMFFLLFQAGEILGSAEDEQLAQRVKELLATVDPG